MDLPTPPFPLATATMFLTPFINSSASNDLPSITFAVTLRSRLLIPSSSSIALRTSSSICSLNGHAGVVSSNVNFRFPELRSKSLIMPIDTMSLFRSGSITVESLLMTSSTPTIAQNSCLLYLKIERFSLA